VAVTPLVLKRTRLPFLEFFMTDIETKSDKDIISGIDKDTIQSLDRPPYSIGYNPSLNSYVFYKYKKDKVILCRDSSETCAFFNDIFLHFSGKLSDQLVEHFAKNFAFAYDVLDMFDKEAFVSASMAAIERYEDQALNQETTAFKEGPKRKDRKLRK
jgi:hypothetical protein